MNWREKIQKVRSTAKSIKAKTNKFVGTERMKETKARAKNEVKKAQKLATDLSNAEKRLTELKSKDAIEKKRQEIADLEKRLTTKGKVLTGLESMIKTGVKMAQKEHRRATRANTRPRKSRGKGKGRK